MMTDLLNFEADMITLQVLYNSIGNQEFNDKNRIDNRKKLCPKMGYLYPDFMQKLITVRELSELTDALKGSEYKRLFLSE